MRSFELNIFIDRSEQEIYDHLELITLIGLQAFMTTMEILKKQRIPAGSYSVSFIWAGGGSQFG